MLAAGTLGLSAFGAVLAIAGAALQQVLGVAAASLCTVVFLVPGLYFLAFSRRLRSRDLALVHTAAFVKARDAIEVQELADELHVSREDAKRILRIAVQEGYVLGTFERDDRFVAERSAARGSEERR
jgi:hypothetical protein